LINHSIFNHSIDKQLWVLLLAAGLDYAIADPWHWLHPTQVMGYLIGQGSQVSWRLTQTKWGLRCCGLLLGSGLILGSGISMAIVLAWAYRGHWLLGMVLDTSLLASCFAGRSLRYAAQDVLTPLAAGHLTVARQQLSRYVGRDTDDLSPPDILRAILETVSENATDGVFAPLFYALLGAGLGVGSTPLAMAYKAASTLDSMIGYKEPPYTHLGWFSARLEDGLTWLPCRCVVVTIALFSGRPRQVYRLAARGANLDPSPNSGWSEGIFAAALGVQMGGENRYRGVVKYKPLLGEAKHPINAEIVQKALDLIRWGFIAWLTLGIMGIGMMHLLLPV
jgi:adenosylcobinamide-phosphate synthase